LQQLNRFKKELPSGAPNNMDSFYLICFCVGLVLSLVSVVGGFGHLHIGRFHIGHVAQGHPPHGVAHRGPGVSAFNGFTITAFLCWFGGIGYLLHHSSIFAGPLIFVLAAISGVAGAALIWAVLFKVLLPHERVLTPEDTEMTGMLAQVSDSIRDGNSIGEIIYSQTGARRAAAARSEDGHAIERGVEVVVIRYERGVAYVRRWDDLTNGVP
jgi:membrane protein implicated in regulation of membrane protease activity